MATVVPALPSLSGELSLYHTTDPLLSNSPVLVFHGPAATIGATSSRVQVHVFTPAGHGCYARLSVSPTSPLYSAVSNLPREEQGDEVVRGLAFGLKKYFLELPDGLKKAWCAEAKAPSPSTLFGDNHVAILASRMAKVENVDEVIGDLKQAFGEQRLSWLDVDVVLPPGSIKQPRSLEVAGEENVDESHLLAQRYSKYAELVDSLGELTFMPTSKLKRAPSKSTTVGRSASFLRQHKENVHKEICELLETEEGYVERVQELSDLLTSLGGDLGASNRQQFRSLFPPAVEQIANLQSGFLKDLRATFDTFENGALADIEATSDEGPTPQQSRQDFIADTQGIGAIAGCLCDWLPQFEGSYQEYMQTHAKAAVALRTTLRDSNSPLVPYLQDVGEQRLTSLLIEPIQRLPRYNLYIDSIVKQLPARHPAIKSLLKARDLITRICDQEDTATATAAIVEKLRSRVSGWPGEAQILGRLVTTADFTELTPPYTAQGQESGQGILILFADGLIFLEKTGANATSAKALMNEIENSPAPLRLNHGRPGTPQDLRFLRRVQLDCLDTTECHDGTAIQIVTCIDLGETKPEQNAKVDSLQILRLDGQYERKVERFTEEMTKARIEHRFGEDERESTKWEVRTSDPLADTCSLFSTIFEDSNVDHIASRAAAASIRVVVDIDRHSRKPRAGQDGIRTVVSASPLRDGLWRLTIDSVNGNVGHEHVALTDIIPCLRRRLTPLISSRFSIDQPRMMACLLALNADVLRSTDLRLESGDDGSSITSQTRSQANRPKSPRKFLSSFLSSTGPGSQPPAFLRKDLPPLPPPGQISRAGSFTQPSQKPPSRESRPGSKDQSTPMSTSSMRSNDQLANPLKQLEDTLSTYMLALQARKGNIVGRNLKMRASADELAVNELYNGLLDDPNLMVLAAHATVDVLFSAFEKFLNVAWKEQIGQVLPYTTIRQIQAKAESLFPSDFDEYFRSMISDLPPQNQRAFKGIMTLLADLLDGTGNDGDRGILTAAFAELLVTEGKPHDFIALIDRFVDDPDTYFGEPFEENQKVADGAFNAHKRARSVNSASITSNTSSLRKKFGFGLSRENSKSEQESKVASVWRTLSKSTRGDASPANSISKGTLYRSHSTDSDIRGVQQRPSSQDGASIHRSVAPGDESFQSAMSSAHNLGLSTIGEHPSFIPTGPPRKKRRSSLSDLSALDKAAGSPPQKAPVYSPAAARRAPFTQRLEDKSLPNSPVPSTPSSKGGSGRFGSPTREPNRSRLPSSFRKENSPGPANAYRSPEQQRPKSSGGKPDEVVITARPTSNIPSLTPRNASPPKVMPSTPIRSGLAERPGAGNIVKKPSPSQEKVPKSSVITATETGSPKKLRMQSPQKIRERLQNEQSAVNAMQSSLQDELSKIGDELTSTPSRFGSVRNTSTPRSRPAAGQSTNIELAQRVLKVEGQLPSQVTELNERINKLQTDLTSSLTVSETKCKKLDDLYREANGENEALYARFNDELGRILKAVKGGEGADEMKKKLKESQDETAKLKRENGRLKRENVGLRAQLKE